MIFCSNGFDPRRAPPPPEGFSEEMWLYHKFSKLKGWTPREIDELTLEEEFWLPLMEEAEAAAAEQLSK